MIVRRRHTGNDFTAQPCRAQHNTIAGQGDEQIGHRNPSAGGRGGPAQVGDLVVAQPRPGQHIADAALGKMNDLGEDRVRPQRLLGPQMSQHVLPQHLLAVAETAQQIGSRRPASTGEEHTEPALCHRCLAAGEHGSHRAERVGQGWWRILCFGQSSQLLGSERDLVGPGSQRRAEPPQ